MTEPMLYICKCGCLLDEAEFCVHELLHELEGDTN